MNDEKIKVTLDDMLACAEREVGMRERVYPKRVADGKMRQDDADRELARMKAIYRTLFGLRRVLTGLEVG